MNIEEDGLVNPELSSRLAVWPNLWSDGAGLARHARWFMAERFKAS